jgi:hypothetical protein
MVIHLVFQGMYCFSWLCSSNADSKIEVCVCPTRKEKAKTALHLKWTRAPQGDSLWILILLDSTREDV